jgi:hypothetical protein
MCFKTRMIEKCGEYMAPMNQQMRDDLIPDALNGVSSEQIMCSTLELAKMTSSIRELTKVFRDMVEKHPLTPPCDATCDNAGENTGA